MRTVERLAEVCWSYGTTAVSPITTVTQSSGAPSSFAGDLGEHRPRALAHVGRAGVDDDAAVGQEPDGRVGEAGRRARLDAEGDAPAAARPGGASPTRSARPPGGPPAPSRRRRACRTGMNASPLRARLRRRISRRSIPSARAPSSRFDSTAQLTCGLPKPRKAVDGIVCERTLRATIRAAGTRYGPAAGVAALADHPVGDVGVGADEVVGLDVLEGERAVGPEARSGRGPRRTPRRTAWNVSSRVRTRRTGRPGPEGHERHERLVLRVLLAAEAAARVRGEDPDLGERQAEDLRQDLLQPVRVLDRAPDGDPVAVRAPP